jgi:GTP1/Obg family GTP-binding protein
LRDAVATEESAREAYAERLTGVGDDYDADVADVIKQMGLGRIKGCHIQHAVARRRHVSGNAVQLAITHDVAKLPSLGLPEVAICGASNAGKSSLLNALLGVKPTEGMASVNGRPGWTKSLHLFLIHLGDPDDPLMSLVDCPGYGEPGILCIAEWECGGASAAWVWGDVAA